MPRAWKRAKITRVQRQIARLLDRLTDAGALPTDSDEERLRKGTLTLVATLVAVAAVFWVGIYAAMGLFVSAAIPFGYQIVSAISIAYFIRTRRFAVFRFSQLCLMLILPGLLQWSLGGFVASSGVIAWASLGPLGALMFHGPRQSVAWLAAYLIEVAVLGIADGALAANAPPIPSGIVPLFFVMNISTISAITYLIVRYFAGRMEEAQARSERLLLNVLPRSIAERLKRQDGAIADGFADVTVLFADIVDFTGLSADITPARVVAILNDVFSAFDRLADQHGLEKIKTIGDAYMAVAGLPSPRPDHAEAVADMALDMQRELFDRATEGIPRIRLRIGINSGPVVAGVIGTRKFIYDLWGDAVNTASRMESHGVPDGIQVTQATYDLLKGKFTFAERGSVDIKGKGAMTTYLLRGRVGSRSTGS